MSTKKARTPRRRRRITHRVVRFNKTLQDLGRYYLEQAAEIWGRADGLDTAVRDEVAEGVARIVRAGNDCIASNLDLTTDQWMSFIDNATADWFRVRGFAEWFCIAAANGFNTSRPCDLSTLPFKTRRIKYKPRAKKKKAL